MTAWESLQDNLGHAILTGGRDNTSAMHLNFHPTVNLCFQEAFSAPSYPCSQIPDRGRPKAINELLVLLVVCTPRNTNAEISLPELVSIQEVVHTFLLLIRN